MTRKQTCAIFFAIGALVVCACSSKTTAVPDSGRDAPETSPDSSIILTLPDFAVDDSHAIDTNLPAVADASSTCSVSAAELTAGAFDAAHLPTFGTFSSPDFAGTLCDGGTFVTVGTQPEAILTSTPFQRAPADAFMLQMPTDGNETTLSFTVGLGTPSVGVYDSSASCGTLSICTYLPVPDGVDCAPDGWAGPDCPPGCAKGPPSVPSDCMPVSPAVCYAAAGSNDCDGAFTTPVGSFQVVIASVTPIVDDADSVILYQVHGELTATLVEQADAGGTMSMDLHF